VTILNKATSIIFHPFCLDRASERLWRGSRVIKLRPKAFAVLNQLVERPGQLITKDELLSAVWPNTFVSDAALKVIIRQLRQALDDDPKTPQFIETAHRRGYRFIGKLADSELNINEDGPVKELVEVQSLPQLTGVVGRERAIEVIQGWFQKTRRGERQLVFVTGEAGIGKSTLVDAFAQSVAVDPLTRIARGQCLEQYGTGEAYLPIFDAMDSLCREQPQVIEVLRAYAPMWLLQMPSLVSAQEREVLSREVSGASRERMLREMGDALEVLTKDQPLVLVLEDLHWSDYSTLDLISYLSTQRSPAHLMLIGTYRTVELIVSGHPLRAVKQQLLAKQQCEELPLEYLNEAAIAEYLALRFPANRFPARLASVILDRTDGNPLFMVNAVDYLVAKGLVIESEMSWTLAQEVDKFEVGVPDSIKQMIERQIEDLDPELQRILEIASVAGSEFSSLAVVAGAGDDRASVEALCERLARQHQLIQDCGLNELPNGEVVTRYGFVHSLYQNVLYKRLSTARRAQLHLRIALAGEVVYGDRAEEIAAELAMHFERGRDYQRAAHYFEQAAKNAIRCFAYEEAINLSLHGFKMVTRLPDGADRDHQELSLCLTLGVPLIATKGYAHQEVGDVYLRARELADDTSHLSEVLWGLWTFNFLRADLKTARQIAAEFLELAERQSQGILAMRGHWALETTLIHMGEFALALAHFEKALQLYDPSQHLDDAFRYAQNPGVGMPCHAAWALWFMGQPDQALKRIEEALARAHELSEPHGRAHALYFASILHHLRREPRLAQERAEAAIAIAAEHGLVVYQAYAMITRGWALIEQGHQEQAIEQMRQGVAAHQATGAEIGRPRSMALLAQALDKSNQTSEGLNVLEEALAVASRSGELYYQAELYRLKGELLLKQLSAEGKSSQPENADSIALAETCFEESLKIAQQQQAKSWQLRAVMSMVRLSKNQPRREAAYRLLTQVYDSFTEGFDTPDLLDARALLQELPKLSTEYAHYTETQMASIRRSETS
jgi:predicted ATPase/DNA-binding winged helix-turn-helix (wHTH) protein